MKKPKNQIIPVLWHLAEDLGLITMGVAIGALLLAYLLAGEIYDFRDSVSITSQPPPVDAIVCLGGGRGRIAAAGDLWYRYWENSKPEATPKVMPILYFSGLGPQTNWNDVTKLLRKKVLPVIRPSDTIIENESSNTDTNARWLAKYAQERHWRRILLVTSSYHMKRAYYMFNHVLKTRENPIEIETYSVFQDPFTAKEWRRDLNGIRVTLMEYLKWVYYRTVWSSF